MKTLKSILIILTGLLILSSCSSVKNSSSTLLIGKWKNVKVSPLRSNDETIGGVGSEDKGTMPVELSAEGKKQETEQTEKLSKTQSLFPTVKNYIEFRKDKTATYSFKDKSLNGKWSLDKSGKTVTFTGNEGSGTYVFEIRKIDSQTLQALERFPQGELRINYQKE